MKIVLIFLSVVGLSLTIIPSILVFTGKLDLSTHKTLMTYGMLLWFATATFWIKEKNL